jgi:hypothetical protein
MSAVSFPPVVRQLPQLAQVTDPWGSPVDYSKAVCAERDLWSLFSDLPARDAAAERPAEADMAL